ncbi:MAG: chloride channel protein [Deltaproteobacteria bacterium]|nr:chloride channel protein [Deltaproteobacteria bacterium]
MLFLAILIGICAGFGAIGLRALIKYISSFPFSGAGSLLENIYLTPWYIKLTAPAIGGLIVGPIIYIFASEIKGSGVPDVMRSVMLQGGYMRPRVAILKALATAITLGSGGSVGREGPIIQIGASLGSTIGQFFGIIGTRMNTLVACGAAAGIAAAFNAPLAGVLFSIEIILLDFAFAQFSPIVISAVTATFISHQFEGNFAAFQVPIYNLIHPAELLFYGILGVLCGVVSFIFTKWFYFFDYVFTSKVKIKPYLKPALGGFFVGVLSLAYPQILGLGYDSINEAIQGNIFWPIALTLVFVKIVATSFSLGSGSTGGIFGPSLFIGAMLGCFFGSFIHGYLPGITASPGAYALVAMSGLVAGTTRAPITAIVIVFELTNDYHVILPLMITCIISTIISSGFSSESIYTLRLINQNISLKKNKEINLMKSIFVRDVISTSFLTINEKMNFNQLIRFLTLNKDPYVIVTNEKDEYGGIISLNSIKEFLFESEELKDLIIAKDVADRNVKIVYPDDNCQKILDIMARQKLFGLPVAEKQNPKKIIGMVWQSEILDAYHEEIEREIVNSTLTKKLQLLSATRDVHIMEGISISEVSAPKIFYRKTLKNLDIRAKYGVHVLSIKHKLSDGELMSVLPGPDEVIKNNSILVVAGEIKKINILKTLS